MTLRLAVWSGPRNVSTALMYAFAQRRDTRVLDEPLYAAYLATGEGRDHPGRDDVLASQDTDGARVVRDVLLGPCDAPVLMAKHMAHHLRAVAPSPQGAAGAGRWPFLRACTNVLLTRRPRDMLASLAATLPSPGIADTGLPEQVAVLDAVLADGGVPVVLTAEALLADPPRVLAALCEQVGLAPDPAMTSWPAGPKPYDGVWAPHWYTSVHASTGFAPPRTQPRPLPRRLEPVLAACAPLHARLERWALRA